MHSNDSFSDKTAQRINEEAALWLAKRDRGLTPEEQDLYLQWLRADLRHASAMRQQAAVLERMMQLYNWQPGQSSSPNADLFKPKQKRKGLLISFGLIAAAALLVIGFFVFESNQSSDQLLEANKSYLKLNQEMILSDGSRVQLKDGSNVIVNYTPQERRVRLTGGEAQFNVSKDQARPFYVEVAGIQVRAVGTAFNVKLDDSAVEVLVTEGKVKVLSQSHLNTDNKILVPMLAAGEKAVVQLANLTSVSRPVVTPLTQDEVNRQLDWQAPRLNFHETTLADAVAEFNRLNIHRQIVIADPSINTIKIGGTFRSDNVEGFVRLLNSTLGIKSDMSQKDRVSLSR